MSDVLTDKQYKTYESISRYSSIPLYYNTNDDKYVMATTEALSDSTVYTNYKVQSGDTLDKIAYRFYLNPTYYWAIADFNRIRDPFKKLTVGTVIKVPTISQLAFIVTGV